ncbi:NAD-dependent succinate-semialdehyde dehydrogenase [Mucilaginibacter myungsuensis]|uniref:NAD-dependent succinate-semialdehyde dehydrogenase n=1 Tax=Mucilaginibacter myungsuensis TaxID=649104 RepID=A0A929KXY8_9SPHI|nr:NAD-dependent succinate-semialdehyde dehydrogenase [Mucilaginibacter myungsuensis]MBE9663222.1 NAD-dependent succinate-semialdehyde dehydrogenase [Mucilaginibacter myungsuensis]MDN3598855.1 NAD-dependent succinate-semialdehyde dehydrogenase [Mucilaginibacter myungsuensis]
MNILSINPADNKPLAKHKSHTPKQVRQKIKQTHRAWLKWRNTAFNERSGLLKKMADVLLSHKEDLAVLMANEMGKPLKQGIAEVEKCAAVCTYYAGIAESFLKEQIIATDAFKSYVTFQPIGVVLAVMPWNFPLWQVFRFLAPALAAGNCGVLKHASNVPGCALAIEDIVKEAGFPDHVFQTLLIGSGEVEAIIADPLIQAVTLTGSNAAGSKVAAKAGELIKKTVLELGGSDAYIILKDADLEQATEACVNSRLINGGQSCIAAKRFIVEEEIETEFTRLFVEKMRAKVMGDPLQNGTDIGPQARADLRDELHDQVIRSVQKGAKILLGGEVPKQPGAWYPPTVLTGVKKGMPASDEELFGPVAAIISARDEEHAITLANDNIFGLGAAIFTADKTRGEHIAATRLEAGSCFVNTMVKSDPRLPFGGIKQSGYGRELGMFGIHEFVNIKTVFVA